MEEIVFKSQQELYERIRPALRSKKKLLSSDGYKKIKESDIWDYMRNKIWVDSYGLELCDMVDDILHADNADIASYCHDKYMSTDVVLVEEIELPKFKS